MTMPVVDERQAGHRVAAAAHGDGQAAQRRIVERGGDVVGAGARTMWRGRRSMRALKSVRASSYSGSPGSYT